MTQTLNDRIYLMYRSQRRMKYSEPNWYPGSPEIQVARRFKITCAQVRQIVAERKSSK